MSIIKTAWPNDQVEEEVLDVTVANLAAAGLQQGHAHHALPRRRERVSLTVRRVERVIKALRL